MKAKLLSSTARMRALTMSSPAKKKCEGEHKESATPSKSRRNSREAGGRVGMEERGKNYPNLYSIFLKLSLPGKDCWSRPVGHHHLQEPAQQLSHQCHCQHRQLFPGGHSPIHRVHYY